MVFLSISQPDLLLSSFVYEKCCSIVPKMNPTNTDLQCLQQQPALVQCTSSPIVLLICSISLLLHTQKSISSLMYSCPSGGPGGVQSVVMTTQSSQPTKTKRTAWGDHARSAPRAGGGGGAHIRVPAYCTVSVQQ